MTVRQQILDAIVAAVEGINSPYPVGAVIDAADPNPDMAGVFTNGQIAVEMTAQSDRTIESEGEKSGWGVEVFRFDVILVALVPERVVRDADVPRRQVATDIHFGFYRLYTNASDPEAAGTWGNLAIQTKCLGGGGYGMFEDGSDLMVVEHAFEVTYRYKWGDPEVAR